MVHMSEDKSAQGFFDHYTRALLDRDATAIAALYAVPALIEFPGQAIAVSDSAQTEEFFSAAFGQYEGVTEARAEVHVIAETGHSVWADVRWFYDGTEAERFVYQLVLSDGAWKIAVLTPMGT